VLAVVGGAFLCDLFTGGGSAPADPSALLIHPSAGKSPKPPAGAGRSAGGAPDGNAPRAAGSSLNQRLLDMVRSERLDVNEVVDAFMPARSWLPEVRAAAMPAPVDAAKLAAEQFVQKHQLAAVMANSRGGHAIIDGQTLLV